MPDRPSEELSRFVNRLADSDAGQRAIDMARSRPPVSGEPSTKRGRVFLDDLRSLVPTGLWTPFREEQIALSIAAIEAEARATPPSLAHNHKGNAGCFASSCPAYGRATPPSLDRQRRIENTLLRSAGFFPWEDPHGDAWIHESDEGYVMDREQAVNDALTRLTSKEER